jgi:GNAT superfamily N-acetyltransferase
MSYILESLSHPALGRATEMMYQTAMNSLGRIFAARFYQTPEATWFVKNPVGLSRVVFTSLTAETPKRTIDATLKTIAASSEDAITWDLGPSLRSSRLEEGLCANGWSKQGEVQSMVLDLQDLKRPTESPAELTIELVEDEEAFKQHIHLMAIGFAFPEAVVRHLSTIDYGRTFLVPELRAYVGRVDGQAVAISLLLLSAGLAGIYNVATIPQMRKRGFGAAMTLAALLDARDLGYHIAVLQASEMGANIYRQLGFQDHFLFDSYSSQPSAQAN